ncbi:MAG TPA: ATP-binding protein [Deinococcales bacterium]|nr:ATP-binding protein [Deinococcales bacterium]
MNPVRPAGTGAARPSRSGPARPSPEASLTEALDLWTLEGGLVVLADGRIESALELELPSLSLAGDGAHAALGTAYRALLRQGVPQGERLRLILEVNPARETAIRALESNVGPDAPAFARALRSAEVAQLEAARRRGQLVEQRLFATLSCTFPGSRARHRSLVPGEWRERKTRALAERTRLAGLFERAGAKVTVPGHQELFELTWRALNPTSGQPPQCRPLREAPPEWLVRRHPDHARATLRAQLTGTDLLRLWRELVLGDAWVGLVSLPNLPVGETRAGMLHDLTNALTCRYRLTLDLVHKAQGPAHRALMAQARRLYAASGEGAFSDYSDPEVRTGAGQLDAALENRAVSGAHVYDLGLSLQVIAPDREALRRGLEQAGAALAHWPGVSPVVESAGLYQQFLKTLPLNGGTNERLSLAFEENAVDLMPHQQPNRGASRPVTLAWTRFDTPHAIDPFDPRHPNFNGLIVGASGSGKTFLAQTLLADLIASGARATVVDRGRAYETLTRALGGDTLAIEPGGELALNPFDLEPGQTGPDDAKKALLLAVVRAMLGPSAADAGLEAAILTAAIHQAYARSSVETRAPDGTLKREPGETRLSTLTRVLVQLEQVGERPASDAEKTLARTLALKLQPWTGDTPYGRVLDRPTSLPEGRGPLTYFDTSALETFPELRDVSVLLIADRVWRQARANPLERKVVLFDEAWSLLKIPSSAAFITELYRRLRKDNAGVYAVTQSLADFTGEAARGLLQNTTLHYLLPLPGERQLVSELLGLSQAGLEAFDSLAGRGGRHAEALAWTREDAGPSGEVIVVRPTPLAYWTFTSRAAEAFERRAAIQARDGNVGAALEDLVARDPRGLA